MQYYLNLAMLLTVDCSRSRAATFDELTLFTDNYLVHHERVCAKKNQTQHLCIHVLHSMGNAVCITMVASAKSCNNKHCSHEFEQPCVLPYYRKKAAKPAAATVSMLAVRAAALLGAAAGAGDGAVAGVAAASAAGAVSLAAAVEAAGTSSAGISAAVAFIPSGAVAFAAGMSAGMGSSSVGGEQHHQRCHVSDGTVSQVFIRSAGTLSMMQSHTNG
jgi:hypothetical protein